MKLFITFCICTIGKSISKCSYNDIFRVILYDSWHIYYAAWTTSFAVLLVAGYSNTFRYFQKKWRPEFGTAEWSKSSSQFWSNKPEAASTWSTIPIRHGSLKIALLYKWNIKWFQISHSSWLSHEKRRKWVSCKRANAFRRHAYRAWDGLYI